MRTITRSVIVAVLALGTPAVALAQGAPAATETQAPPAKTSTAIRSIKVVDVKDMLPDARAQVEDFVARTKADDLTSLRASLDALPQAASALKDKGMSSAQVVAINIEDGVLTMFAKTA